MGIYVMGMDRDPGHLYMLAYVLLVYMHLHCRDVMYGYYVAGMDRGPGLLSK